MIKYDWILDAQETLVELWGEDGKRVIEEAHKVVPFNGNTSTFLEHCIACGGNWGGMFLSGIKKLYPNVWETIPEDMGLLAMAGIAATMLLCGVDTSE